MLAAVLTVCPICSRRMHSRMRVSSWFSTTKMRSRRDREVDADARLGLGVCNGGTSNFRPATASTRQGNVDPDGGSAVASRAFRPDFPAMRLDYCLGNSKSESQPAVFARHPLAGLVERLEDRRQLVRIDADAAVGDR